MSEIRNAVIEANREYASDFGKKGDLPILPACKFAVLTCMDARLIPSQIIGLSEGDAHVIRNAGGRASLDAIRSLIISYKLLGTKEFFVIHHTNCGMEAFTGEIICDLLESSLDTAELTEEGFRDVGTSEGSSEGKSINWLTIKNQAESILEDVRRIKNHPLVPGRIPIYGYLFDVKSGELIEIREATKVGAATA